MKKYLNYNEAMKYLNIGSYNTLKKFISQGLKVSTVGGINRISKDDIDDFMQKHIQMEEQNER